MPVFRGGPGQVPAWCELHAFDIVRLVPGQTHRYDRLAPKEKLLVGRGACTVRIGTEEREGREQDQFDLPTPDGAFVIVEVLEPATLIRLCGAWGDDLGGAGLFGVRRSDAPHDRGDRVAYPKETDFDAHYHDCDEYWVLFEGRGTAVSEGKHHEVGPGDCVATGMGHHHDFPLVVEPVRAVFFETTMEGRKRRGHLWEHTHGPAEPQWERMYDVAQGAPGG